MTNNPTKNTGGNLEWFTQNLPTSYLNYPEQYLYNCALEVEELEDIAENRRRFKALLVERKVSEGMELEELDQKQADEFMNPNDPDLKVQRSEELVELTQKHLDAKHDFTQASRLAFLELFHKEAPLKIAEMDEDYFTNRELIEADLKAYLEHANGDSLHALNTNNPKASVCINTQSSEKVQWQTYLSRASGALLGTSHSREYNNPPRCPDTLHKLLRIIYPHLSDMIPMDENYFNSSGYVNADLNSFLQKGEGGTFKDLSTTNPKPGTLSHTQSGEAVSWNAYLNRASGVLFGTDTKKGNRHRCVDALKILLRVNDPSIPEYIPMDEKYFNNPEIVQKDLRAYLQHANGDSIRDLNTRNPRNSGRILISSGEMVRWETYLNYASKFLLGTKQGNKDKKTKIPHRRSEAVKELMKIAGVEYSEYIPMDENYFRNPENVKKDLDTALQYAKVESLLDLNTNNPNANTPIIFNNGEKVSWSAYLNRASGILLGTRDGNINPHRCYEALRNLVRIVDTTLPEYIPMDEKYFKNPEYIKQDFETYLQYAEGDTLQDLSLNNPKRSVSVLTRNGETMSWLTYLVRAAAVLFGIEHNKVMYHHRLDVFNKLFKSVGVDAAEVLQMDESYFNNPENVKNDLNTYLQHAKGETLADLTVYNPGSSISIFTRSGQKVKWQTYLKRASGALFGTKYVGDNLHRPNEALIQLLNIIGIDINDVEIISMDEDYFNNHKYVRSDLEAYLQHSKYETIFDLTTGNPNFSTSIVAQNRESVKWNTYLKRASAVLLGTKDNCKRGNSHKSLMALKKLLRIVDPTLPEYIPMDATYFNNSEYIRSDLNAYLEYAEGNSFYDLNTNNPKWRTSYLIKSGEKVTWNTYLNRASAVLLGTRGGKKSKNLHRPFEVLKLLIKIAEKANDK